MLEEGLHLFSGFEGRVLCVVSLDKGQTLWMRQFANSKSAFDILTDDDGILTEKVAEIGCKTTEAGFGFHTKDFKEPGEGYKSFALAHYVYTK
jgi:hypothetical protein